MRSKEQKIGSKEQGIGSKGQGIRSREQGIGSKDGNIAHLPGTTVFAATVLAQSGSREKFFDRSRPIDGAAQNDTFSQSEKAKVKWQKDIHRMSFRAEEKPAGAGGMNLFQGARGPGGEYLPSARFFGAARPVHRAAQNDTVRGVVQKIYTAEIGTREKTGKNDGKRIEEYLAYVGLGKRNPWCAALVCWVYGQAGVDNPRSGWSPALFPKERIIWARSRRMGRTFSDQRSAISRPGDRAMDPKVFTNPSILNTQNSSSTSAHSINHSALSIQNSRLPRASDVFGIWFQDKKRIAHCGFIDDWQDKYVITVEGNTNESGSRDGDGVYRKRRLKTTVYKVARWVG